MAITTEDYVTPGAAPAARSGAAGKGRRAARPEGQWALGQTDPLNHNEEFKAEDNPLNVRARIIEKYSVEGFDSITSDDLRGRFRWMGLYTQRKPGIDGGRTAQLEPHELDDIHFMMRVRVDGGSLSLAQLEAIADISTTYCRDSADITDRQNIQFHWVRVEDVPAIWERLEAVGLDTTEACGDCPRVILGSPVAGVIAGEVIDPRPAIAKIKERFIGDPTLSNLPRKFKSSVSWHWDAVPEINDISFVGVVHPEHGPGFDLLVGGGLSTSAHLAVRLGAWVPEAEVPEVWHGVTQLFRDYGYRRLRNKARLKYLVQDLGALKVREILETEYLQRKLIDGPAAQAPARPPDYVGVHDQADGLKIVGFSPIAGRVSGTILTAIAQAARAAGSDRVTLTPLQKLLVLDVAPEKVEGLIEAIEPHGPRARASTWRRGTLACTGLEYCKLAIVETKARAATLVGVLESRLGELDLEHPVSVGINGCPNSCARIQTADIGLKGQIVVDDEGNQVEGFQVHLGGGLGLDAGFGRKLRGHKVTAEQLPEYVERVVRHYADGHEPGERFAQWAQRAPEDQLV
ncbi:sulfite reductase (ferredoxin) [Kineosphaera limosa]|uniref:assimilatory sulfite reductase (ferredoxin) n=1 Tax=Kineosphaera limosa NBRC 100340 TaxID=1184609 RepID=K6WCX6_9MICO|nr:nitrite/sulfite reductase [Kineosphaera limosa]NYE00337.1 sulfite reductase (ferredoxin) [Kineosphaera limosa]GAB97135.1 putative sulfite reductase [Kineosphaera limosa NBRC 100340]